MKALSNANDPRGEIKPLCIGFTSNVNSEAQDLPIGVSVRYAQDPTKQWYVLRVSYGRAIKVANYLENNSADSYYLPTHYVVKLLNNKRGKVLEPLLPNFIFIYAGDDDIAHLTKNSPVSSYLSFYYNHFCTDGFGKNPPLTIDYDDMMNFINATSIENEHIRVVSPESCHYKSGDIVQVIEGDFKGVEGRVARVAGQQRVIVELKGLCLVATAYVPSAFIQLKEKK